MSFFRYPGGKSKLKSEIINKLNEYSGYSEYREPFFGGGSIGLEFLKNPKTPKAWINDKDAALACLWTCIINYSSELKDRVMAFKPSIEQFYKFKEELVNVQDMPKQKNKIIDFGFKKLAIHQISYSGLGTKSGGPLGGAEQKSNYKIDCRWSPEYICKKADKLHDQFSNLEMRDNSCGCSDFSDLLLNDDCVSLIYLDPPYYEQGNNLYQCGFTQADHERLAYLLKTTKHSWVLSYDNRPEIKKLYSWATIRELNVKYSIAKLKSAKSQPNKIELLIYKGV